MRDQLIENKKIDLKKIDPKVTRPEKVDVRLEKKKIDLKKIKSKVTGSYSLLNLIVCTLVKFIFVLFNQLSHAFSILLQSYATAH